VFRDRFLERRRISQEIFELDRGKLGVRRGSVLGWGTTGEDDPWWEGATTEISDVADTIVDEKSAKDSQARCAINAWVSCSSAARTAIVRDGPAPVAPVSKTFI
jgi:hypothetical protein